METTGIVYKSKFDQNVGWEEIETFYFPSLWNSIGTIVDLKGILFREFCIFTKHKMNDEKALKSDWETVGQDFWGAIKTFQQENIEQQESA